MEFLFCAVFLARVTLSIAKDLARNSAKQSFKISESSAAVAS
jgi:hypothetical protein